MHRIQFLLLAALPIPTLVCAADFSSQVVSVSDGDTIEVLNGHHTERIRLSGIDCPEKGQAYGQKAKQVEMRGQFLTLHFAKARACWGVRGRVSIAF